MSNHDKICELIRNTGPILPLQAAKLINSDTIIASAHLSDLVATKRLKISHVKVGGSPVYYLPGQEPSLQNFTNQLNEKEKRAYELLREKKILQDTELEPLFRVALRNLKDFAVPLTVKENDLI